jgi:hypothetical protein
MTSSPSAHVLIPMRINALVRDGFSIIPRLADDDALRMLERAVENAIEVHDSRRRSGDGNRYAMRNLLELDAVRSWATREDVLSIARPAAGNRARPVRGLLFDKTTDANWKVAWHQDRSIAVCERHDVAGFGPWSVKAGVVHVQPPVAILERMITIRLHLDDCDADNGPLRVVPGSHRDGILSDEDVLRLPRERGEVACLVPRGGAVLMRPLLLHASSAATNPRGRRVIHIEYSGDDLPAPLEWHAATATSIG